MKLEIRNIFCGYKADASVLEDVTFSVETGEICVLLGPNGVGKTTLFKSILILRVQLCGRIAQNGLSDFRRRAIGRNWFTKKGAEI